MFKILIVSDDSVMRLVLKKTLENQGYDVTVVTNGAEGIAQAKQIRPALIICDWMMSHLNGLEVCRLIRAMPEFASTFFILLAARGNVVDRVMGLDAGADEFLSKPLEMNELKARVRAGLRLCQINQALQITNQNLQTQKQALEAELAEAGAYVRSLLPPPLVGGINTEVLFVPSKQLGGDCFDYYWLDNENLVIYLLDVSGHGVGSALLSVSVLNVLRSQSLINTDFSQPSTVLKALNNSFQMSEHSDKYFTIWYGVYNTFKRRLTYANAGHPPALLLPGESAAKKQHRRLVSTDLPIGFFPDVEFNDSCCDVEKNSTLYIFSDGIYEIHCLDGKTWGFDAFIDLLTEFNQDKTFRLETILTHFTELNAKETFEDDLSLLKIAFN